jgi:5-methylthioadenosine/S-adenosylhomocysteine deaminase
MTGVDSKVWRIAVFPGTVAALLESALPSTRSAAPVIPDVPRSSLPAILFCLLAVAPVLAQPRDVDLLLYGDLVVTMDSADRVLADGAVAVDDGAIVGVGPRAEIDAAFRASERLDGAGRVLMPGLVNGHGHAAMTLLRGVADDLELMTWLNRYIFPAEVRFVDEAFVRTGTELACLEMIRGGTTTFVDMYYYPDTIAEVVEGCGLRGVITATVINQRSPDSATAEDGLALARAFLGRWQGRNPRITAALGPHALYTLTPELLTRTRELAEEFDVPVSIHLSESPFEIANSRERFGTTPVHKLETIDFFRGHTIAAHVIWPTDDELPILATRSIGAIHNPTSNMKIASGVAPVARMLEAGVSLGLGTDGAASNNDLNMWEEMRLAAFLQKVDTMDPTALPAPAVLRMATAGGAQAIGLGARTGSLEVGKRADLIQVSVDDPRLVPLYDVVSHLVYVADQQDVVNVVVDGQVLMRDRQVLTLDQDAVIARARALAEKIRGGLGIETSGALPSTAE